MVIVFLRSFRASLVVILTIPLSVLAALLALFAAGKSVNALTLGGLALAVGRLVDDVIVVLENILRHAGAGKPVHEAIVDGTRGVGAPILVATVATCIVFVPVLFLEGLGKFLFGPLALAVTFAMLASYVLALTLVPVYVRRFLGSGLHVHEDRSDPTGRFGRAYRGLLTRLVRRPGLAATFACASVAAAVLVLPTLGRELFPRADAGQIAVYLRGPSGARLERTEQLAPGDEITKLNTNIGILYDWPAAYTNAATSDAFLLVELGGGRSAGVDVHARRLREAFARELPAAEVALDTGGLLTAALSDGATSPIAVVLESASQADAERILPDIIDRVRGVPGAVDVRLQERLGAARLNSAVAFADRGRHDARRRGPSAGRGWGHRRDRIGPIRGNYRNLLGIRSGR